MKVLEEDTAQIDAWLKEYFDLCQKWRAGEITSLPSWFLAIRDRGDK